MKTYLMLFIIIVTSQICAQVTTFEKTYGGVYAEAGFSVQQTSDGGYILTGRTVSFGGNLQNNIYLIKTDSVGDTIWTKYYVGPSGDIAREVEQTYDGGYIIVGETSSFGAGSHDIYLIKTDAQGDTAWTRTYGSTGWDEGYSVTQTSDSGYVLTGFFSDDSTSDVADVIVMKINSVADTVLWTQTFGALHFTHGDAGFSVQQTSDGGYVVAGLYASNDMNDQALLVKMDPSGDTTWLKTFGGVSSEKAWSVQQTSDGGFIVVGTTLSFGAGDFDVYVIRTDVNGNTAWTKTYGGADLDEGRSVWQTTDGGFIITGLTYSFGAGSRDVYLIKINSFGDVLWEKTYGGVSAEIGYSVQQTEDGGYIVVGETSSFGAGNLDVYLIKTDSLGNQIATDVEELNSELPSKFSLIQNYPNPFNPTTTIRYSISKESFVTLKIYNLMGEEVATLINKEQAIGNYDIEFNAKALPSGVYLYRIQAGDFVQIRKMKLFK
jgi:hypothetical protein